MITISKPGKYTALSAGNLYVCEADRHQTGVIPAMTITSWCNGQASWQRIGGAASGLNFLCNAHFKRLSRRDEQDYNK